MNKVVHFEIPFDDKVRAMQFYKNVFGWQFDDMPEMNYVIARSTEVGEDYMPKDKGVINGGMYKRDAGSAKSPVLVIDVPNIDEHIKKVVAEGGKVYKEKVKVGEMGYYAQVLDSEGNIIGIWEHISKPK
jgi:uncharacterized protein